MCDFLCAISAVWSLAPRDAMPGPHWCYGDEDGGAGEQGCVVDLEGGDGSGVILAKVFNYLH